MPTQALVDLEGMPRAQARVASPPATSAITQERAGVGPLSAGFIAAALLLGVAVGATAWVLGMQGGEAPVEVSSRPLLFGLADVDLAFGRAVSACAIGVAIVAVALAGRSFARSEVAGLLAAALVALDPSVLAYGRLAVPTALTLAALAVSLACFASSRLAVLPWLGAVVLAFGAFIDPRAVLWGPVLALFALLRGNIYASPRHLGIALTQTMLLPALGALLHLTAEGMWGSVPVCLAPSPWRMLALQAAVQPGPALLAVPNPVTWFAGLGAVLFLGIGGGAFGATRFRMARANGRLQARLVAPFPTVLGRGAWILLLAVAIPIPQAWILLFALALALGVQNLGEDAPGFGLTLAIVLLVFALVVLWRSWEAVAGTGGADGVADALGLVPWAKAITC